MSTASDVTVPAEREVIEFDVVTASSDDGEYLYLEDSSSGTDVNIHALIPAEAAALTPTRFPP